MKTETKPSRQYCLLIATLLLAGLSLSGFAQTAAVQQPAADNEYQTGAVLWLQSSAEARALQYQAFALARLMLDQDLRKRSSRRRAVVVDVDETVLDNSRYQGWLILKGRPFEFGSWKSWCDRAEATPIAGALEFLRYAASRRVRIFYVTNRRPAEREGTLSNLRRFGFPDVSDETLLLRTETSSKEPRRRAITERHRIVLLIGDNLNDLAEVFEGKTVEERLAAVDRERAKFGAQFIVLPNPMYGEWETAIYGHVSGLSEADKAASRKAALKAYE